MKPTIDEESPPWSLPATGNQTISSASLLGSTIVLYFYPRDSTPGCTSEAHDFRDSRQAFDACNAVILGVSQDNLKSHEKFKLKQELNFELLSDEQGKVCQRFDVIKLKKMYGREFEGIERSTFIIDKKGILRHEWRKVKVKGHVAEVLAAVTDL
ncbi:peroxiredoxin [Chromatiales bacterium (ex Bugula neritina AB1)]|nr:peroxiredoxin [Chromatiales bacterium (ex Bugula neritina AB1)]